MIRSFRNKGLKRFFEEEDSSKLRQDLVARIRTILTALDHAKTVTDLDQPHSGCIYFAAISKAVGR